jgi:hypothetical protein
MPLYEYIAEAPGQDPVIIELLRSAKDADAPVPDPEGKGRVFRRRLSVVSLGTSNRPASAPSASSGGHVHSGSCGCGKPRGSCGM